MSNNVLATVVLTVGIVLTAICLMALLALCFPKTREYLLKKSEAAGETMETKFTDVAIGASYPRNERQLDVRRYGDRC